MLWYTIEILSQKDVIRLVMNVCSSEQKMDKILCITRASIGKSGADIMNVKMQIHSIWQTFVFRTLSCRDSRIYTA